MASLYRCSGMTILRRIFMCAILDAQAGTGLTRSPSLLEIFRPMPKGWYFDGLDYTKPNC